MTVCTVCGCDPCINPSLCRACREVDRRKTRPRYAPPRPAPPPIDLPKADLSSKDWKQIAKAWNSPGWKQAALIHARGHNVLIVETPPEDLARLRRLMSDDVSPERAWDEINRTACERYNQAPEATYDAVVYELRTYGLSQLSKANCQRRLSDLSVAQLKSLMACLQQRRRHYPKICDGLLGKLGEIYNARTTPNVE